MKLRHDMYAYGQTSRAECPQSEKLAKGRAQEESTNATEMTNSPERQNATRARVTERTCIRMKTHQKQVYRFMSEPRMTNTGIG